MRCCLCRLTAAAAPLTLSHLAAPTLLNRIRKVQSTIRNCKALDLGSPQSHQWESPLARDGHSQTPEISPWE